MHRPGIMVCRYSGTISGLRPKPRYGGRLIACAPGMFCHAKCIPLGMCCASRDVVRGRYTPTTRSNICFCRRLPFALNR